MGALTVPAVLHAWRHPPVRGAAGRCIGRTDLPVDPRRAKRLAHRMRAFARRNRLPRIVVTSPLARCRAVGIRLARWGWQHRIDAALLELDFGAWDGLPWSCVPREGVDAWCSDLAGHAPAGGESVGALLERVRSFDPGEARMLVTHGGWLSAALWHGSGPPARQPTCAEWPPPPRPGQHRELVLPEAVGRGPCSERKGPAP